MSLEHATTIELQETTTVHSPEDDSALTTSDEYPTGIKFILITIGLTLSIFLVALDSSIISTAIPKITDQFGSVDEVGWYSSSYAITNAAFQSTWGKAYKHFDLKRTFLLTIAIFEAGNIICALATSSTLLILGRVVSGIGGGGVMTGSFIAIAFTAKPAYRAAYMGILSVTFGVASVVGPLLGGLLTDGPGWRFCFWISLPIGALAAAIMLFCFTTPRSAVPTRAGLLDKLVRLDVVGALLVMAATVCFVMAMHWAGVSMSWSSPPVLASLITFGVLLALFVVNEWGMGSKAMIQSHLLKKRSIVLNMTYSFFLAGLFFPMSYSLPIQFQSVNNKSASESGIRLIPLIIGVSVFTMVSNAILTFWRHYTPLLLVGALASTAGTSMIYTLNADASTASWIGYEVMTSVGVGLALQVPMIANQAAVGSEDVAAATSLTLFCENIGTALSIAATGAAFTNGLVSGLRETVPSLDPLTVVNAGATQIRVVFNPSEVQGILLAYLHGCKLSHVVSIVCGAAASIVAVALAAPSMSKEWQKRVRKPHIP